MNPVQSLKYDKAVIDVRVIGDDYFLVTDALSTVRYLDMQTLEPKNQLKANAIQERYINSAVAFSSDAHFLALMSTGAKEAKLFNTRTKKLVGMVNRHHGDVACVAIDPKDKYMFSGGEDGITFGVDIASGQLAFTLPKHIDTINDIAFSKNGEWVATGSYDKNIAIFNLTTMTPRERLKSHSAPVVKLLFLNNNRLISFDKKSMAIVWDFSSLEVITRLQGIHDDITKVTTDGEERFLFIGTKLGYILVYDLKDYEKISIKYLKFSSVVTALSFDNKNNHLLVGLESGEFLIYNIFEGEKNFYELITYKKYAALQAYIDENPLLVFTEVYKNYEKIWELSLKRGKELLENNEKQAALKFFESFMEVPSKKQAIQKLFAKYQDYDKFLTLINQNKMPLAYGLANANPLFKETRAYEGMEAQWKKSVALAQKYLLSPNNEEKVKEIFAPYRGITEKTLIIQDLMQNSMMYNRFKTVVADKNFRMAFEYAKKYSFLQDSPEYAMLIRYSDSLYMKAQTLRKSGDTLSALKLYKVLLDFDDYKESAKNLMRDVENEYKFFNALNEGDMVLAYTYLDESEYLKYSKQGKELEAQWENDYKKAGQFAAKSDVLGVENTLYKYAKVRTKFMAIGTAISWCYINQLNSALKRKLDQKIIEDGIKNYILHFGLTDQITTYFEAFLKDYPECKLNLEAQVHGSMESWRPAMIKESILEEPLSFDMF